MFVFQVGVVCAVWHLLELSQQSNDACIRTALCTTTQNLDEDSFDMLYKNDCWAALPGPIWTTSVYESYHPLITISLFIFSILRDLGLNLGFLLFLFFNSHCIWKGKATLSDAMVMCSNGNLETFIYDPSLKIYNLNNTWRRAQFQTYWY